MIAQFIDPHVHCRWTEYHTDYLQLAHRDAIACGIGSIMEMPNTSPALTTEAALNERSVVVRQVRDLTANPKHVVDHNMHVGLTDNPDQVRWAFAAAKSGQVGSVKMFLTHSTGNMGLLDPDYQKLVWKTAAEMDYRGTILMHCEDEKEWQTPFNYRDPVSHSIRQNPESETIQVEQQFKMAADAKFRGMFYVCHVSSPYTLDYLTCERNYASQMLARDSIVAEVTWHHLFLNYEDYKIHGNRVKMNPPLRSPKMQELLLQRVLRGEADIIGSDHAPHPVALKDSDCPPSGIPALPFWPKGVEKLRKLGLDKNKLEDMTRLKAMRLFRLTEPKPRRVTYDPSLWGAYGWNPFSRVDGK